MPPLCLPPATYPLLPSPTPPLATLLLLLLPSFLHFCLPPSIPVPVCPCLHCPPTHLPTSTCVPHCAIPCLCLLRVRFGTVVTLATTVLIYPTAHALPLHALFGIFSRSAPCRFCLLACCNGVSFAACVGDSAAYCKGGMVSRFRKPPACYHCAMPCWCLCSHLPSGLLAAPSPRHIFLVVENLLFHCLAYNWRHRAISGWRRWRRAMPRYFWHCPPLPFVAHLLSCLFCTPVRRHATGAIKQRAPPLTLTLRHSSGYPLSPTFFSIWFALCHISWRHDIRHRFSVALDTLSPGLAPQLRRAPRRPSVFPYVWLSSGTSCRMAGYVAPRA